MNGETLIWLSSALFIVPLLYADSQYECGAHGRFEYCIDGIPGCVVGCHCHPGYYFDTDTKICEPNIKLTQDFRRHYHSEPTRVNVAPTIAPSEEQPTTYNAVDEKIDEIAKDADDLGDWLYNQFFKTIENQVINKTQGEELPPTRRSGNILLSKPVRRSHKYWKGRKKKKKRKSKSLKKKLLRITEDDSIFDSDSASTSNEDETTSSSESASIEHNGKGKDKNDDHGHKKIIIFNKKPQPPLPSFIFLPNMDSPYYSPIGLPPPPAVPMYPMVPVPPMVAGPPIGGPLFSYPGGPSNCEEDGTSSATTVLTTAGSAVSTVSEQASSTTESTTTIVTDSTTTSTTSTTDITTEVAESEMLRKKLNKKRKQSKTKQDYVLRGNRNKLFKKIRDKIYRENKLNNYFGDQYQGPDAPLDVNDPSEYLPNRNFMWPNVDQIPSPPPNVNFKYLAELIHKADLNKNLTNLANLNQPNKNISGNIPIGLPPSRRSYYPTNDINNSPANNVMRQISRMEDPNDSFYANLGKQIASMIRKIDSNGEREVNIEIEENNPKGHNPTSTVFDNNNYRSRSYWERFVRSPVKNFASFIKQMDHLKKSNEDLFSLENKVEIAASTSPTLSLHDIENIINTVQKVQLKPKRNKNYSEKSNISNVSFKLNLLPGNVQTVPPISEPKQEQSFVNTDNDVINERNTRRKSNTNGLLLSNFRHLSLDYDDPMRNTGTGKNSIQNMKPTRMPSGDIKLKQTLPAKHLNINMIPTFTKETANRSNFKIKYQLTPVLLNHRSLNYHTYNKNPYLFENAMPVQYARLTKNTALLPHVDKPSYFHHEFHHYDYFDK